MPYCGSLQHASGLQIDINCTTANTVTILGFGSSNKLLEATFLTFTGNSMSTRTVGSTIKRYVIHFNGITGGGTVNVTMTYNGGTQINVNGSPDAVAIFDVT